MENITRSLRTALQKIDKPASEVDELVRRRAIAGTVESVDLEAGLVTIRTRGDAVVTVAVVDATRIVVGGEDGILDDLQDGDRVEIVFDSETNEAVGVHVRLVEEVKAKIESIDLNAGTVTLALRDGAVLTLNITDATQVRINRIQAARGDLESGMVLVVRYNRRTLDVVNIDAELRFEIEITVEEVDRENGIIRGRTADGRIIVQRLAPDANVEQGSVSASIRAIAPGTRVLVVVDKANDRALVVRTRDTNARTQHVTVRGRPTNVDTDGSTLTIERPDGGSVTVIVDTDTDMTIDGEPATLGDVTAETALSITFDAESKLALKVLGRTRVEPTDVVNVKPVTDADVADDEPATGVRTVGGTIVNGDADTNTLVIFTLNRRKVELHITSETLMSLNGEPVDSVHDLPRGAAVKAAFNAEDRTAIEVSAQKRDVDVRAVLKKETVKRAVEQVRRPTQNLAIQVKGVPTPGAEIRLIIYLNRQPVEGAQVTVNERDAGTTNADGALAFQVPADAEQLNVVAVFNDHKAGLRLKVVDRRQADLRQAVADRLKQAAAERRDEAQSTDRPTRAGLQVRVDGPVAPGGTVTIKIERDGEIVQGAEVKIGNRDVTVLASGELTFTVPADRAVLRALGIRLGTGRVLARIPVVVSFEGERAQGVITIVRPGADGAANIQRQDGQSQQATPQRTTTTQRQASTQTSSGN